jgi:hypothetical protein
MVHNEENVRYVALCAQWISVMRESSNHFECAIEMHEPLPYDALFHYPTPSLYQQLLVWRLTLYTIGN